jgi:hypothetical protein
LVIAIAKAGRHVLGNVFDCGELRLSEHERHRAGPPPCGTAAQYRNPGYEVKSWAQDVRPLLEGVALPHKRPLMRRSRGAAIEYRLRWVPVR